MSVRGKGMRLGLPSRLNHRDQRRRSESAPFVDSPDAACSARLGGSSRGLGASTTDLSSPEVCGGESRPANPAPKPLERQPAMHTTVSPTPTTAIAAPRKSRRTARIGRSCFRRVAPARSSDVRRSSPDDTVTFPIPCALRHECADYEHPARKPSTSSPARSAWSADCLA